MTISLSFTYISTVVHILFKVLLVHGKMGGMKELCYFRKDIQQYIPNYDALENESK